MRISFTRLSSAGFGRTISVQVPEDGERTSRDALYSFAPPAKFVTAPPNRMSAFCPTATDRNSQFEQPPQATEMRPQSVPGALRNKTLLGESGVPSPESSKPHAAQMPPLEDRSTRARSFWPTG